MDTRINSSLSLSVSVSAPSFFISPQELGSRLGHADAPLLLDVRPQARFDASPRMLVGAQRCSAGQIPTSATALFATNPNQEVVAYCTYGHHVGVTAAAALRTAGLNARALEGGFEGGEEGVDSTQDIMRWRLAAPLTMAKRADWGVPNAQASRWVTRARPKIDRIACPWLIRRFIDPQAEFFYVPTERVFSEATRLNAVAFDIPGAPVSHVGELCSFDALLAGFELSTPGLEQLARIVRGADTDCLSLAPQSAGLLAFSLGLSQLHADDHAMLEAAMPFYDALYAWCSGTKNEPHNWAQQSSAPQSSAASTPRTTS